MKTIIFDMDGVIIDSEPVHCKAWIKTYQQKGITIDEDYYFTYISGKHGMDSTRLVLERHGRPFDPIQAASLILKKDRIASDLMKETIQPVQGVVDLIRQLSENHKLGLGSTSSMIVVNTILNKFDLEDRFNVVIGGEGVKQGKPHPEVYEKIARLLEEDPFNCVVIEDSKSGIMAAKSAGMKCIAILNSRNKKEDLVNADRIVSSFAEITPEIIETL